MEKQKIINEIKSFLDGRNDDLKYLVNVETDPSTNIALCVIHEPNKEHYIKSVKYEPFIYIKDFKKHGFSLYNDDKEYTIAKMKKYGITIKKMKTGNQPRLENGYPYKVTSKYSYNDIMNFFKDGGISPYDKLLDENDRPIKDHNDRPIYKYRDLFYTPKLNEQFFISTGARLFKGIEEYKDLHKLTFDIETTGLRYQHSRIFAIGVKDNRGFEMVLEVAKDDDDDEEVKVIQNFFNLISLIKPAVISGYNSEEFDFEFILGRAEKLGMNLNELPTTLNPEHGIQRRRNTTLKIGNSTEKYTSTTMWGYSVLDILHAVKRTIAVNTDIKNARLKYICQYEDIAKENRMYIDGDKIGTYWKEDKVFWINKENNNYLQIPDEFQNQANDLYLMQENKKSLSPEKYKIIKKSIIERNKDIVEWFKDATNELNKNSNGNSEFSFTRGKEILRRYLLDDLWETEQVDNLYNQSVFLLAKIVPTTFGRVATMGNAAVWNLLMTTWSYENDLAIPHPDENENFVGGLTRCFKKGYTKRLVKIDYASLYPMIQLTDDVFPIFDISGVIKKMLMYMTTTRNIYKKLANADDLNDEEIALMKEIDHETYNKYINNSFTKADRSSFKVKQLPIKILNNSLFGALGSGFAFNWSDNICAYRITCAGRLHLRHAIHWFSQFGCVPLLAVTDGVNFGIPDRTTIRVTDDGVTDGVSDGVIEEMWQYGGAVGIGALIKKYNKEEMKPPFMSVDNDGEFVSCLNLSRINYALAVDSKDKVSGEIKRKVKLTGNTIKSKTMPEYIEEFIDNGLKLILDGMGEEFVSYYHDYAEKIFYKQIPLKKIASKSKVKSTLKDYLNRGTDKNGKSKAKQAHMELLILEREKLAKQIFANMFDKIEGERDIDSYSMNEIMKIVETYMPPEPTLDSMVYYVNIGERKSHGDVKTKKITNDSGEEVTEVSINAKLISQKDMEENPDLTGDYNVDKYLDAFNKRVEVLLDGFDESVRDKILVKIERKKVKDANGKKIENVLLKKNIFKSGELSLKNFNHDQFEESMFLEEKEIRFWNRSGYDPKKVWNKFSVNENELTPEIYQFALDYISDKMIKTGKPPVKSVNDELKMGDYVLLKNYREYSLGYHNGEYIEILRTNLDIPKSPKEIELETEILESEDKLRKLKIFDFELPSELIDKIEKKRRMESHLIDFKKLHNIDESIPNEDLFSIPNFEIAFNDYVSQKEVKEVEYDEEYEFFDEGDY